MGGGTVGAGGVGGSGMQHCPCAYMKYFPEWKLHSSPLVRSTDIRSFGII